MKEVTSYFKNVDRPSQSQAIFERFSENNHAPATELVYQSPFELLIAVILSAQATDKRVNQVTRALFSVANTPEAILALGELALKQHICSINYYATKAKHILKTCALLIYHYHGQVPNDRANLESLPGVGRKTANVILNVIFHRPEIAVDTHIFRVANRTGLAPAKTPRLVEKGLSKIIPSAYQQRAHHWLVLHGRYVCKARQPLCHACLIQDLCDKNFG